MQTNDHKQSLETRTDWVLSAINEVFEKKKKKKKKKIALTSNLTWGRGGRSALENRSQSWIRRWFILPTGKKNLTIKRAKKEFPLWLRGNEYD